MPPGSRTPTPKVKAAAATGATLLVAAVVARILGLPVDDDLVLAVSALVLAGGPVLAAYQKRSLPKPPRP